MFDKTLKDLESILNKSFDLFKEELGAVRGNRPSVEFLENVKVEYYGQAMSVKQLGSLNLRPPREIEIHVWDKNAVQHVAKAIDDAKSGFSVSTEGSVIRASLPVLTDERRKELVKLAGKAAEAFRIKLRSHRDECIKRLKTSEEKGEITEDELFKAKDKIQKLVDETNKKVEDALKDKIKEIEE